MQRGAARSAVDAPAAKVDPPPATASSAGAPGTITRVAGQALTVAAASASFNGSVAELALEPSGSLLIADRGRVRRLANGLVTVLAGTGESTTTYFGDGRPAYGSPLGSVGGMWSSASGDVYIADALQNMIKRVAADGTIHVVAGNGQAAFSGDRGPATGASLSGPEGVVTDSAGNVYIADSGNHRIRRVTPDGTIATIAGTGVGGSDGDGGPAVDATLDSPGDLGIDRAGRVIFLDGGSGVVRAFTPGGSIVRVAGGGANPLTDGAPATSVSLLMVTIGRDGAFRAVGLEEDANFVPSYRLYSLDAAGVFHADPIAYRAPDIPHAYAARSASFAVDSQGVPYIGLNTNVAPESPGEDVATFVTHGTPYGSLAVVAGRTGAPFYLGPEDALSVPLNHPDEMGVSTTGDLILRNTRPTDYPQAVGITSQGVATAVFNTVSHNDTMLGVGSGLNDSVLYAYVVEGYLHHIVRVSGGSSVDAAYQEGGTIGGGCDAQVGWPDPLTESAADGIVYFDGDEQCFKRVLPNGEVVIVRSGDGLKSVDDLAPLPNGDVLVADGKGSRVWRLAMDGTLTPFAGTGTYGSSGDDGPALDAQLALPTGVAVDSRGYVYIADAYGSRIRVVSPSGLIETYAGIGTYVYAGDGGDARAASFSYPSKVGVDDADNVYVLDQSTGTVRRVTPFEALPSVASRFVPVSPTRIMDTRSGLGVRQGVVGPAGLVDLQVAGANSVPADASAVALNVTATEALGGGYVQVFPTGRAAIGSSSSLNVEEAGATVPNFVIAPIGADGKVSFYSQGGAQLVADLVGYYEPVDLAVRAGRYVGLAPTRVLDTRQTGKVPAGETVDLQVAGAGPVPAGEASAVVLNVTLTEADAPGFVQVIPTDGPTPLGESSSLNATHAGQTVANLVMVPLGSDGSVTLYTMSGGHLVADVMGYVTSSSAPTDSAGLFVPVAPTRLLDTRSTPPALGPGGVITIIPAGRGPLPPEGISGYYVNVTATNAAAPGYVQVLPAGQTTFGGSSNVNVEQAGDTIANAALIGAGSGGGVSFYVFAGADLVIDCAGWFVG
jgi:sugar lactone lactonase YvrE